MTLPTNSQATPAPASATPPEQTPAPAAAQEKPAETPSYVTKEALEAAIETAVRRATQSSRDRDRQIEDQVKAITTKLEKAGAVVSPEITQNLRQQVTAELETQEQPQQPAAATPQPPASGPSQGDPVYDWTVMQYRVHGIDVKPSDPEWNKYIQPALDDSNGEPDELFAKYQAKVIQALAEKRERTASQTATADARVLGGSNQPPGQAQPKTAHDAWAQAYDKK
jgi:hypothetical protein